MCRKKDGLIHAVSGWENRIFSKNLHLGQLSYDILEGKEERSGSFEESDL